MGDPINRKTHIRLTSHPGNGRTLRFPLHWGAEDPIARGPIVGTVTEAGDRNAIGTHGGSYSLYRALAVTSGALNPIRRPDLHNTSPVVPIGPHPSWFDAKRIVSLDPFGHIAAEAFGPLIAEGVDIRPTIAITRAHLTMHELNDAVAKGRLKVDGTIMKESGDVAVTKAAIEPVWYLPGIAERFGVEETRLRRVLFEQTGGMYPELVTRPDLLAFLPPIGSISVYIFGDAAKLADPAHRLTCRVHDECNGSDVFGSDICTCRPYLIHGIEECVAEAQQGGVGLVVYNRKEGRALGEVTKFLVYNARKRQEGGDTAAEYFERTECVAGVQDARFQELMPDVLHWLGVKKIHRFISMSNMKYDSIVGSGIEIGERVSIPDELIPADASVEIEAKKAAGYYSETGHRELGTVKGRGIDE
ncbi:GTP cyclohydrolase II [Acuticoccus sp. I52.16.1]|uniref:GTP cyclohydrolase II n=1 Tax=Acuticoccus sp. I52.16.1 TaxID=2928472 RepID=UPI001FD61189|nr:GTP cyclohydrolase II [Acuticoccus sp. I52.16.1]UOM35123.1 GTP cyclohydrolase II [Acuticoccus sp. I52.16.1]